MPAYFRWIGRALLMGLCIFAIYYPYKYLLGTAQFHFSGDLSYAEYWWSDDDLAVPLYWRALGFALYLPTVLATVAMICGAIWLTWLLQRGTVFDPRTVRALKWVGIGAALAGFTGMCGYSVESWVLTAWNVDKPRLPLRFGYDSGEMGVFLTGLGIVFLAQVLELAAFKYRENQEIV